jgi:hypothetical protein
LDANGTFTSTLAPDTLHNRSPQPLATRKRKNRPRGRRRNSAQSFLLGPFGHVDQTGLSTLGEADDADDVMH